MEMDIDFNNSSENIDLSDNYVKLLIEFLEIKDSNSVINYNVNEFINKNYDLYTNQKFKIINKNILYNCNIKCNIFDGNGIVVLPGGVIYDGMFTNGFPNFYGKISYSDNTYYIGEWKNGLKNGKGTFVENKQNKYIGCWRNNKKHGEGKMYEDNEIYYVYFNNNILTDKILYSEYLLNKGNRDLNKQLKKLNDMVTTISEKFYLEKKKNLLIEMENNKTLKQMENIIIEKTKMINNYKNNEIENELEKYKVINEGQQEKINNYQQEYDLAISQYSSQISKYQDYITNLKNHYDQKISDLESKSINNENVLADSLQKNEEIKRKYNCKICLSNESNILLKPCNHLVMCESCENEHKRISGPVCPICRAGYYDKIKVFI